MLNHSTRKAVFNAKLLFKVIQGHQSVSMLMKSHWETTYSESDIIILVSYMNFGKIWRPQKAKMAIFDDPTLIWFPLSSEPPEYLHNPYIPTQQSLSATFPPLVDGSMFIQILVMGSERQAQELLPFKVIQGHRFWYKSKAQVHIFISD